MRAVRPGKEEFNFDYPPFSLQSLLSGLLNMETQTAQPWITQQRYSVQLQPDIYQFRQITVWLRNCYTAFSDYLFRCCGALHGRLACGQNPERAVRSSTAP